MINPKYDPSNYLKHLAVAVITDNQKINQLFGSYLLRVRWWHDNPKMSPQADLTGTLRIHTETPFGALEPRDYQFKISSHKQIYVQFLTIPIPEFEYKIEVIHPVALTRSRLELWEYIPPQTFANPQTNMPFYPEGSSTPIADPALIAAVNASTAASASNAAGIAAITVAINAQPTAIANAINNDSTKTLLPELFAVDTVPVLVLAKNALTRGANISNQGNTKVKLWCGDDPIAASTAYTSSGYLFHMEGKGSYELPEPFYKSNVWAVGNTTSGQVSTTRSIDI